MIEQLIKENTEAMRELTAALRAIEACSAGQAEEPKVEAQKVEAQKVEATKVEAQVWTRESATEGFLKVCATAQGKALARDALTKLGKTRLSEVPDDLLPSFMKHIGL